MRTELWAIGLVLLGTVIGSLGPILFKKGADKFSLNPFKMLKNYYFITGCFMYGLATIIFIPALRGGELSVLYPFVALVYVWVALLSIKLLKEKMNLFKWLGIVLILAGVTFIGLGM
jgi:uncharacterized membrane protein